VAKMGHKTAFDELYRRHAAKVFWVAHRITRHREDAEDAVQESFLSAYVHLNNFEERARFSTWLTRTRSLTRLENISCPRTTGGRLGPRACGCFLAAAQPESSAIRPVYLRTTTGCSTAYSFSIRMRLERFSRPIPLGLRNRPRCASGLPKLADANDRTVWELPPSAKTACLRLKIWRSFDSL
jgi:hypothetical protein